MLPRGLSLALLCALLGCSSPYHTNGLFGGFTETRLAEDVFRVTFRGNGFTAPERAQDLALLRAADVALQHGYTCFAVLDERNGGIIQTFTQPGEARTSGTATVNGPFMNYEATTTYSPGWTMSSFHPKTGLLVRTFRRRPEGVFTFDAAFLATSLRQKYHLAGPEARP